MLARLSVLSALLAALVAKPAAAGFVSTSGSSFQLDGKAFSVFGTNGYWISESAWTDAQLTTIFSGMAKSGLTVCRLWGFNDVTSAPSWGAYYQLWSNGNATINTGANGLGYFDKVVAAAKAAGVKLVVPFVNNWSDYGGMDVYVKTLGGQYHDDFYTSEKVKTAYKTFVKTFVNRYKSDDTIMAWQLCNECRCGGSGDGLPKSGKCTTKTITTWATEMSAYIKSLDAKHLVAIGDEGFLATNPSDYLYSGSDGVDFDANLAIASIDYGTYHSYPDSWGVAAGTFKEWGLQWIKDHVASGTKAKKPVIMEEYGVKSKDAATYQAWSDSVYELGSNMQYWQYGVKSLSTTDDGFTIYDADALFTSTIAPAAAKFAKKSGSSSSGSTTTTAPTTKAPATTTKAPATTSKAPAATTKAPATTTKPTTTTKAPAATTKTPAVTTKAPKATTAAPAKTTKAPAKTTEAPTASDSDSPAKTTAPAKTSAPANTAAPSKCTRRARQ